MLEGKALEKYHLNQKFFAACRDNQINAVKNMLENPVLRQDIDVSDDDDSCLRYACMYDSQDVVKYLMTSPLINPKPNVFARQWAPLNHIAANGYTELLHFFLFEVKIKIPPNLIKEFTKYRNDKLPDMISMIEARIEKDKLEKLTPSKSKSLPASHIVYKI